MLSAGIAAVGVVAPGLACWTDARPVLRGDTPYAPEALPLPAPEGLPATERRRASCVVRLALAAASQTLPDGADPAMPAVFASGEGDMDTFDHICRSLAAEPAWVSPHRFHNSVHNAPAGYWSIAAGCRGSGTSLSAGDDSFAAGLVEALAGLLDGDARQCLLVAYDQAAPAVFQPVVTATDAFAAALLLDKDRVGCRRIQVAPGDGRMPPHTMADPTLERLRADNPAARALPLLSVLARSAAGRIVLPWGRAGLSVQVEDD